eukprot:403344880
MILRRNTGLFLIKNVQVSTQASADKTSHNFRPASRQLLQSNGKSQHQQITQRANDFDISDNEQLRSKELKPYQNNKDQKTKTIRQQINQGEKDLEKLRKEIDINKPQSRPVGQQQLDKSVKRDKSQTPLKKQTFHSKRPSHNEHLQNKSSQNSERKTQKPVSETQSLGDYSQANSIADIERNVSIYSNEKAASSLINIQVPPAQNQTQSQIQVFQVKKKNNEAQMAGNNAKVLSRDQQEQLIEKDHAKYVKQIDQIFGKPAINPNVTNCCLFFFNASKLISKQSHKLDNWQDLLNYLNTIGKDLAVQELKTVQLDGNKLSFPQIESLKQKYKCVKDNNCELIYKILTEKYGDVFTKGAEFEHEMKLQQQQNKGPQRVQGGFQVNKKPQKVQGGFQASTSFKIESHPNYPSSVLENLIGKEVIVNQDNYTMMADVMLKVKTQNNENGCVIFIEKRNPNEKKNTRNDAWGDGENDQSFTVASRKRPGQNTQNPLLAQNQGLRNQGQNNLQTLEEQRKMQSKSALDTRSSTDVDYKFFNQDLEKKTLEVQDEYSQLFQELNSLRVQRGNPKAFYNAVTDFYRDGNEPHDSPTRRLIDHKNTAVDHKQTLRQSVDNLVKSDYALTYTTSPDKSYVIEPHGGGLNYDNVKKDPTKFYDDFFNQDITQHKIKSSDQNGNTQGNLKNRRGSGSSQRPTHNKITTKVTKRPHMKVIEKIRIKIAQRLSLNLNNQLETEKIQSILQDKGISEAIEQLVNQNKIQIVNQKGQIQTDSNLFGSRSNSSFTLRESDQSPSRLVIDDQDFNKIQNKVILITKKTKYLNK